MQTFELTDFLAFIYIYTFFIDQAREEPAETQGHWIAATRLDKGREREREPIQRTKACLYKIKKRDRGQTACACALITKRDPTSKRRRKKNLHWSSCSGYILSKERKQKNETRKKKKEEEY